ncbi:MAG: redoxin domain-containing protein [Gammaproteobacteria bacterium]|nr:redoxin domain-containing protein [Gammaproteobacteria bacterium]
MNKIIWSGVAAVASALSASAFALPDRIGDFALLDSDGEFHQLSRMRDQEALVLMSFDNSCASIDAAVAQLQTMQANWTDQNVTFAFINSSSESDIEVIRAAKVKYGVNLPLLIDDGQVVSETLALSKAGEVAILDPDRLTILYRGPAQDQVAQVLNSEKAGSADSTVVVAASGCELSYPIKNQHASQAPDYASEVAPIIAEQCANCHREGGIGPFAMDSHLMLQGWSPMIREVLLTKRMPPMQVDPYIGHFSNARYMAQSDIQTLVHWIDAGAPRGAAAIDPLTQLDFPDRKSWQLGEPDYVINAPAMEVPATGALDYIDIDVDLPFDEDKWVQSVQFIAGDESVLHHLLTYVTAPAEDFDGGEQNQSSVARRFLEGYAPGKMDAMTFPENTGVFIPKGHKLSMQFHYTTNGKATVDETIIGLYMYDEPPTYENFTRSVSGNFRIPPYAQDYPAAATYLFEEDVVVTGLRAHMHFRGKDMRFSAEMPDGTVTDLLSVPNYSYAWQPTYQLIEPAALPAGTKVHVTGTFDNSEYNPANPDPSKSLSFGLQSWDEMFIGYWTYHAAVPTN